MFYECSGSQMEVILAQTPRCLTMSRDISGCPNLGREVLLASSGYRREDSAAYPIMHKAVPTTKDDLSPNFNDTKVENPALEEFWVFFSFSSRPGKRGEKGKKKMLRFHECQCPEFLHPTQIQELESTRVPLSRAKCKVKAGLLSSNSCLSSKERQLRPKQRTKKLQGCLVCDKNHFAD